MAEIGTIARPYAQAAFEVAKAENALAGWATFLGDLTQAVQEKDVNQLIDNPEVAKEQLTSLLEEIVKPASESQRNFLATVADESRLSAVPAVYEAFLEHKNDYEGVADAHIAVAQAISDQELKDLVATLEKKLNKKLKPELTVDTNLIGGFCVTVGDEVLDMSVRAKLARMQSALTI